PSIRTVRAGYFLAARHPTQALVEHTKCALLAVPETPWYDPPPYRHECDKEDEDESPSEWCASLSRRRSGLRSASVRGRPRPEGEGRAPRSGEGGAFSVQRRAPVRERQVLLRLLPSARRTYRQQDLRRAGRREGRHPRGTQRPDAVRRQGHGAVLLGGR